MDGLLGRFLPKVVKQRISGIVHLGAAADAGLGTVTSAAGKLGGKVRLVQPHTRPDPVPIYHTLQLGMTGGDDPFRDPALDVYTRPDALHARYRAANGGFLPSALSEEFADEFPEFQDAASFSSARSSQSQPVLRSAARPSVLRVDDVNALVPGVGAAAMSAAADPVRASSCASTLI